MFLAHWDNKSENQRLVCLSEKDWPEGGKCSRPFAMLQDVGSAWGPRKVDLPEWEKAPLWSDRASCTTSMDALPYHGATFNPVKITEAGRKHLGGLLSQLSDQQIDDLFRGARFDQPTGMFGGTPTPIAEWVRVFKAKVEADHRRSAVSAVGRAQQRRPRHRHAGAVDRLEEEPLVGDLRQHEVIVPVVAARDRR